MEYPASTKINKWLATIFANKELNQMLLLLGSIALFIGFFISELAPILIMLLIAYVCSDLVDYFIVKFRIKRLWSVSMVMIGVLFSFALAVITVPRLLLQLREIKNRLPESSDAINSIVAFINQYAPQNAQINQETVVNYFSEIIGETSSFILNNTLSVVGDIFSVMVFLVIMPIFVFFVLKDKKAIIRYCHRLIPHNPTLKFFSNSLNAELVAYLRGKILEAIFVGVLTWWVMLFFQVELGLTLSIIIGLSVFIPFVGVIVVTVFLALFIFLQFGFSAVYFWIMGIHIIIQVIDGQVLVPILFAERVNIHPAVIFAFILFFGNLWGAWGIFLAIPLASFCKCCIKSIVRNK